MGGPRRRRRAADSGRGRAKGSKNSILPSHSFVSRVYKYCICLEAGGQREHRGHMYGGKWWLTSILGTRRASGRHLPRSLAQDGNGVSETQEDTDARDRQMLRLWFDIALALDDKTNQSRTDGKKANHSSGGMGIPSDAGGHKYGRTQRAPGGPVKIDDDDSTTRSHLQDSWREAALICCTGYTPSHVYARVVYGRRGTVDLHGIDRAHPKPGPAPVIGAQPDLAHSSCSST
ncbi:hypothetical protein B0I37DRAFT_354888 [Chaetomium sp. MPI-CAGE-AT-0009]|nr:hypothetical protein B0I37DRAFT_354888 [Chaetomium sp. MPI-CAGE-AT-0009]